MRVHIKKYGHSMFIVKMLQAIRLYWLANKIASWYEDRRAKVKIHKYDTWSLDHTLSYIIVPALKQLKETTHGSPFVEYEDVPEHLRPEESQEDIEKTERHGEVDSTWHDRWRWVLDEMIYAFERIKEDDWEDQFYDHSDFNEEDSFLESIEKIKFDEQGYIKERDRIQNGLNLFGKYYMGLWD